MRRRLYPTLKMPTNISKNKVQIGLILTALLLSVGVLNAYGTPATQYERSIYTSTPILFWIAIIITLSISIVNTLLLKIYQKESLFLAGLSVLSVIGLPLIRGYFFVGEGDPMTHLGMIQDLSSNTLNPLELLYPASHVLTVITVFFSGQSINQSMLLICLQFVVLFIISTVVIVRKLHSHRSTVAIASFSGFMLLPLHRRGLHFAPNTLARLYLAFMLLLVIYALYTNDQRYITMIFISSLTLLFIHPLIMLLFSAILVGMSIPSIMRLFQRDLQVSLNGKSVVVFTLYTGTGTYVWIESQEESINTFQSFILSLISPSSIESGTSQVASLRAVGGSVIEIFLKLFSQQFTYILLSCYMIILLLYYIRRNQQGVKTKLSPSHAVLLSLSIGLSLLTVLFLFAFITSVYYMRIYLTTMVLVTIFGSIGLIRLYSTSERFRNNLFISSIIILLLFSNILILHPSPYIYLENNHVPESQVEGYSTAFEFHDEDIHFVRVRSPVFRYLHVTESFVEVEFRDYTGTYRAKTPDHFAGQNLPASYEDHKYLVITEADRVREPTVYNGLRYTNEDFRSVEQDSQINRIMTNGHVDQYLVY